MGANHSHEPDHRQHRLQPRADRTPPKTPPKTPPRTPPAGTGLNALQPPKLQLAQSSGHHTPPGKPPAAEPQASPPPCQVVEAHAPGNARCSGVYHLQPAQHNGHPWWKAQDGRWAIYTCPTGYWLIGGVSAMASGLGWFATASTHKGRHPNDAAIRWAYMEVGGATGSQGWKDNAPVKVNGATREAAKHADPNNAGGEQTEPRTVGEKWFPVLAGAGASTCSPERFAAGVKAHQNVNAVLGLSSPSQATECFHIIAIGRPTFTLQEFEWFLMFRKYYKYVDVEGKESISAWDLRVALANPKMPKIQERLGLKPSMADPFIRLLDVSGDGRVVWLDFARYYMKHKTGFDQMQAQKHAQQAAQKTSAVARLMAALRRRIGAEGRKVSLRDVRRVFEDDNHAQMELGWPYHRTELLFNMVKTANPCQGDGVRFADLETFLYIMALFNRFDIDRSGYIDNWEFGAALEQDAKLQAALNVHLPQAQAVFQQIDVSRTGSISFSEFYAYFMKAAPANMQHQPPQPQQPVYAHPEDAFQLSKKLGEGSYGVVYLAKRKTDALRVIVKLPKVEMMNLEEVQYEAALLKGMKHPNIIRFIDAFRNRQGSLVIVTEFADGGDLAQKLRGEYRGQGVPQAPLFSMFGQLLEAVSYFHQRGVMHRDLKPDNIFLTAGGCVKVGDLGLAKYLKGGMTHTVFQGPRGVPSYMAPEQVRGEAHSLPIDVWACGCILFEMATGKACFIGPDMAVEYDGRFRLAPPPYVEKIVRAMLTRDQRSRPTAPDVLAMLPDQERSLPEGPMAMHTLRRQKATPPPPPADASSSSEDIDGDLLGPLAGERRKGAPVAHPSYADPLGASDPKYTMDVTLV